MNKINGSLLKRKINVTKFKTWEESKINAAGLEFYIDLSQSTNHLNHFQSISTGTGFVKHR